MLMLSAPCLVLISRNFTLACSDSHDSWATGGCYWQLARCFVEAKRDVL